MATCTRRFQSAAGVELAYELRGNESPQRRGDVVFFNGLFAGLSTWVSAYRHAGLLRDYRLVFFDYPCQGASEPLRAPFGAQALLGLCQELLCFLNVERPVFVGHSLGGMLATMLAARGEALAPQPAAGLMVINTGAYMPRSSVLLFETFREFFARERGLVLAPDGENRALPPADVFRFLIPHIFAESFLHRSRGLEGQIIQSYASYNADAEAVAALLSACMGRNNELGDIASHMANVAVPVQLLLGAEDRIFPPRLGQALAASARSVDVEVLEDVGHSCMVERGAVFAARLFRFVQRLGEADACAAPPAGSGRELRALSGFGSAPLGLEGT